MKKSILYSISHLFKQNEYFHLLRQLIHEYVDSYLYSSRLDKYNYSEEGSKLDSTLGLTLWFKIDAQYWIQYLVEY